jgi:hypothetical protein
MPVHKVSGGYKWGNHGHVYPSKKGAEKQARAIYASGYHGKSWTDIIKAIDSLIERLGGA